MRGHPAGALIGLLIGHAFDADWLRPKKYDPYAVLGLRDDASGYGFADPKAEMQYYMKLGVDGVFTDFPATGVAALKGL